MLVGAAKKLDGTTLLILGLSAENLARLPNDEPILVDLNEHDIPFELLIFAGETEETMAFDVQKLIGPDTKVNIDPRLFEGHD